MSQKPVPDIRSLTEERRFQLLVEGVIDYAIYMLDPDGYIVSWNSGARHLKRYTAEEVIGKHFSQFFTPEDREAGLPERALTVARREGRFESEGWRVRKDGSRFWALAVLDAIHDENGSLIGFAKITRDLTERREAQNALLETERRFRLLIENILDYAICMLDPSGIITNWNAGAERMKGYTAAEIVGQHFSRFYPRPDRLAGVPVKALEIASREGRYEAEGWRVRKDGSYFWASVVIDRIRDERGNLLGFAKITRDITERREAQEALRQSERQFRLLISSVTDYAIYMLDLNGIVVSWNAGAERIKGYSADEIIGQHFSKFYTDTDRLAGVPARALYTATTEGKFEAEGWRVRKDGTHFWASVVIDAVRDESGALIGFAKITRDLTERRQAELAVETAREQLAYSRKMEALGQLTGGVAHDFNNLLMIVGGSVQTLKGFVPDNPRVERALTAIETAVKRGATLTGQMLSFSGRRQLDATVVNLKERMEALVSLLSGSLPPSIRLLVDIGDDIWPLEADLSELELALLNLTLNARDAISENGVIVISAENTQLSAETDQNLTGDFIAITVTDTGSGVPPDVLPRIFEPFFTTKDVGKGSGLGLSQVYGFCTRSHGGVNVKSEVGRGTQITMYLPKATRSAAASTAADSQRDLSGFRVLVVEDNPEVSDAASSMLEQLGCKITAVKSAEAALQRLDENQDFDLIFSDIVMPGPMDGIALAHTINERYPALPILLTSGFSKAAETVKDKYPLLRKPYGIAELSQAISKLLLEQDARRDNTNLVAFPQKPRARKPDA